MAGPIGTTANGVGPAAGGAEQAVPSGAVSPPSGSVRNPVLGHPVNGQVGPASPPAASGGSVSGGSIAPVSARRAQSGVRRMLDPDRELRRASAEVEISGNVDARRRLAEELLGCSQFDAAIEVYQGGLRGIFEHDPTLLLGLARAQHGKRDFAAARATLERLTLHNADFKSPDAQLLYARTLESQDALEEAERTYAALAPGFPGAEARLRYALLLKRRGNLPEAQRVLKDLLDGARLGPPHYRKARAEWLERARRELS